jgi:multidrug efflux system outer membrane protein
MNAKTNPEASPLRGKAGTAERRFERIAVCAAGWSSGRSIAGSVVLLLLAPLCACSALAPPRAPPLSIDVPAGWSAGDAAGAGATGLTDASLVAWWQRFDDPALGVLVGRALHANTSVNGAQASLRQARALRDVAAAALWPTLGASTSVQHGTVGGHSTGTVYQLGLDANWAPDVFGGRRAAVDAADAALSAGAASLGDVQVQVAAEVALDYILLRSSQARWSIASDNLASQQETLQITLWREQAGLLTSLESDQARTAVEQNRALLPPLQTAIMQARHALAVLTGQPPESLAELSEPSGAGSSVPQARDDLALSIPADTLRQRADVRAAEYQVAAALARVGQAQAQRWPSFAIGGKLGLSALSLGALTDGASVVSSLLAGITLPLFDGGALRAQVRVQQAALEQTQQVYRASVLGALRDVEDSLVAVQGDRLRLEGLRNAADAATSAALIARQRYSSGLTDFQTVLETQRARFATLDGVVSASADVSSDHVRLFKALGGGWNPANVLGQVEAVQAANSGNPPR